MDNFHHSEQISRLDEINKELEDLIDQLLKTRVHCHILGVELCTQFSPYIMEAVHNTKIDCEECSLQQKNQMKTFLVSSQEEKEEIAVSSSSNLPISQLENKSNKTNPQNNTGESSTP